MVTQPLVAKNSSNRKKPQNLYKQAGVDIAKGNRFVKGILPKVASMLGQGGGFGAVFDIGAMGYKDPLLVSSTDGVGTKLMLAQSVGSFDGLGQDLVAMCVNDVIAQGAAPLFFLDYIACGHLDIDKLSEIVSGISKACEDSGCALIGGETAEMPQLYQAEDFDLAGFVVGAVERPALLPNDKAQVGDIVLGLASNGVHANGFSLVRKILDDRSSPDNNLTDETLINELLTPTRLYVKPLLEVLASGAGGAVRGIAHITGGGLVENPPRALTDKSLAIAIDYSSWELPEIFALLQDKGGVSDDEMHRVFNCGIGMTLIVAKEEADKIAAQLETLGEKVFAIGEVVKK